MHAIDEWIKTVFLGMVEGLSESLPISSTGHLLIASDLVNFRESFGGTFKVFIQFGAVVAVVVFYAGDLMAQIRALPRDNGTRRFWLLVFLAFLPAAALGLVLRDFIK